MSTNMAGISPAELGRLGENVASVYIERCLGWSVADRNVRTRYGEIDIVARDGGTFRFIEVKARRTHHRGTPVEAVSQMKMLRFMQQAQYYIYQRNHPVDFTALSMDVIGLTFRTNRLISLEHVRLPGCD
jgi:putative endonuclease